MNEWALLLKLMTEARQYRPERLPVPITQSVATAKTFTPKTVSPADLKLLDEYAQAIELGATQRVVLDTASGFYVPEVDPACVAADAPQAMAQGQRTMSAGLAKGLNPSTSATYSAVTSRAASKDPIRRQEP